MTASLRFPGVQNNSDIRKLCTNLVPFSRLHFISQGQAPMVARGSSEFYKMGVPEVTQMMFDSRCVLSDIGDFRNGKILTASTLYRGPEVSSSEVDLHTTKMGNKYSSSFVEWIPNRMMSSICKVAPAFKRFNISGTILANCTQVGKSMDKLCDHFKKMYSRKAYVHWYT